MTYTRVQLEVPFSYGDKAVIDQDPSHRRHGRKPYITIDLNVLELPVPDLSTVYGAYLATPELAAQLRQFSGLRERQFTLGLDPQAEELGQFEGKEIPELICFEAIGDFPRDDFALREKVPGLLISERAWDVIKRFNIGEADVEAYEPNS
ncbi:hypothetical protein SAMN04487788_2311 [Microbacterium testaceum StLB037]|uniref:Uncharacterized protein n=1 Tax=Microbacterium testaceum (strain StLB037) TaxID=979556 RepID=A0A1H0QB89_MICTS|nr:hypothetical protein [Microbacterium testaceum]SDP13928.1 hypothetical protein SAMN04487788_2311 [Microbacterium testaceum StLB037]